jgi:hypothetical protein
MSTFLLIWNNKAHQLDAEREKALASTHAFQAFFIEVLLFLLIPETYG